MATTTKKPRPARRRPFKNGAPRDYRTEPVEFVPTLRDRTRNALKEAMKAGRTLKEIADSSGLEHGWLRIFSCRPSPDPGVNKIEALYYCLTGVRL